jgi:hypothetical protein
MSALICARIFLRALELLYLQCPEKVQTAERATVLDRFVGKIFSSPQFKAYLESIGWVVQSYTIARATGDVSKTASRKWSLPQGC